MEQREIITEKELKELEKFFHDKSGSLLLDKATFINDVAEFAKLHIKVVKRNNNKHFSAYLDRLRKAKSLLS
jgi:hypothetical protein